MIDDILECTDCSEEITLMELRLAQTDPSKRHTSVELLTLQPQFIFGITSFLRITFRFGFDRVQFDTFTTFLDGLIHLRCTRFGSCMIADRIEIEDAAVVIRIGITDGFESLIIGYIAIKKNIIFDFCLMERTSRPCVFLGRARGDEKLKTKNRKDH